MYADIEFTKRYTTYINFYRLSIYNASKLGYDCFLVADKEFSNYFKDLDVEIKIIDRKLNSIFDNVKVYALEVIEDCILIDGDLILNKRLPATESDVTFESYETNAWDAFYKKAVDHINKLDVQEIIPEWTGKKISRINNLGLLNFQNSNLRQLYIDRCWQLEEFLADKIKTDITYRTACAQYLLSELIEKYRATSSNYKTLADSSTYNHYLGSKKFKLNIVPPDNILIFNNRTLI